MHRRRRLPRASALVFLLGCGPSAGPGDGSGGAPSPPAAAPDPAPVEATPAAPTPAPTESGAALRLRGTLVHRPYESTRKSVEAYLGAEFFLVQEDGAEETLRPTDAQPDAALKALVGKKVEVEGVRSEGTPPDPHEQAPIGADGAPMLRGAGVQVRAIRAIE